MSKPIKLIEHWSQYCLTPQLDPITNHFFDSHSYFMHTVSTPWSPIWLNSEERQIQGTCYVVNSGKNIKRNWSQIASWATPQLNHLLVPYQVIPKIKSACKGEYQIVSTCSDNESRSKILLMININKYSSNTKTIFKRIDQIASDKKNSRKPVLLFFKGDEHDININLMAYYLEIRNKIKSIFKGSVDTINLYDFGLLKASLHQYCAFDLDYNNHIYDLGVYHKLLSLGSAVPDIPTIATSTLKKNDYLPISERHGLCFKIY